MAVADLVVSSALQNTFRCKNSCSCCSVTKTEDIGSSSNTLLLSVLILLYYHTRKKTSGSGIRLRHVTAVSSTSSNSKQQQHHCCCCCWCIMLLHIRAYSAGMISSWSLESTSPGEKNKISNSGMLPLLQLELAVLPTECLGRGCRDVAVPPWRSSVWVDTYSATTINTYSFYHDGGP